jgi:hypothetical protein
MSLQGYADFQAWREGDFFLNSCHLDDLERSEDPWFFLILLVLGSVAFLNCAWIPSCRSLLGAHCWWLMREVKQFQVMTSLGMSVEVMFQGQ